MHKSQPNLRKRQKVIESANFSAAERYGNRKARQWPNGQGHTCEVLYRALYSDRILVSTQILPCVMLKFAKIHFYPTWKLHSGTDKDEIESHLRYYLSNARST